MSETIDPQSVEPPADPFVDTKSKDVKTEHIIYKYVIPILIVCIVVFVFYQAYVRFYENQHSEPYINPQPRTDPQSDKSFDVDAEVKKLIQSQEKYLAELQKSRLGN